LQACHHNWCQYEYFTARLGGGALVPRKENDGELREVRDVFEVTGVEGGCDRHLALCWDHVFH